MSLTDVLKEVERDEREFRLTTETLRLTHSALEGAKVLLANAEAELARLRAENEAMREALTLIDALDPEEHVYGCSTDALRGLVIQMGRLARNVGGGDVG